MRCLYLVRTPFQAFLAEKLIAMERPDYSYVWYVGWHTPKDVKAVAGLKVHANEVESSFRKNGDAVRFFFSTPSMAKGEFDRVYVASTHAYYFRRLMNEKELRTFDAGLGNYVFDGIKLGKWVDRFFPLPPADAHYAIRPDLYPGTAVPINLDLDIKRGTEPLVINIGQNFEEYLPPERCARIREIMSEGVYLPHPRETPPSHAIRTDEIAEKYVERNSNDYDITLIGGLSTALLSIQGIRKIYIDVSTRKDRELMQKAGCEVVGLDYPSSQ